MNPIAHRISARLARPLARLQRRFQHARPGSILIMVVALIVLLALMGTAFISSARLERFAAVSGNDQRMLKEAAQAYANQVLGQVSSAVASDSGNVVTCPTDSTAGTQFLASRDARLLPDLTINDLKDYTPVVPVWPMISRFQGQQFESPYMGTTFSAGNSVYFAPSNLVINYTSNGGSTDAALIGQTRSFPAFKQYAIDPNDSTQKRWLTSLPITGEPLYLAADATGMGIANSALIRLSTSAIQGVDFYGAIRVIDNGSAFNANTAWNRYQDLDKNNNCYNFFPCDLDFAGAMNGITSTAGPNMTEMSTIDARRFTSFPQGKLSDTGVNHADLTYLNQADEFWMQYGRRIDNPNAKVFVGDPQGTTKYLRPFNDADTASLAWHGGLVDMDNPMCKLDSQLYQALNGRDSIFAGAANAVSSPLNRFRYFGANNANYWYDWYWNFDNVNDPSFPIGSNAGASATFKSASGLPFRSLRGLTVGGNPVANICTQIPYAAMPAEAKAFTSTDPNTGVVNAVVDPGIHPFKASLNTGTFPELFRGFLNVMGGSTRDAAGVVQFTVPADPQTSTGNYLNDNQGTFRNVIRDPNSGSTVKSATGATTPNTNEKLRDINLKQLPAGGKPTTGFDSKNVLQLRAALAAVNVMTLRDTHGTISGQYFMPRSYAEVINLTTNGASAQKVDVVCFGVSAQPFITEVYASTDTSTHKDAKGNNVTNKWGLVVIKLFNPYPYPISLSGYQFAVLDRRLAANGGTYPAMTSTVTPLTAGYTIQPQQTMMLTSYNNTTNFNYWPTYLGTPPVVSTTKCMQLNSLINVLEGAVQQANKPSPGSEFVLLAPLTNGAAAGTGLVPVDSYDFTGLKISAANTQMINWHYVRQAGTAIANRWKCAYAGEYNASNAAKASGTYFKPRYVGTTESTEYSPAGTPKVDDPWETAPPVPAIALTATDTPAGTSTNPYNGIELCNVDFGGFNKNTTSLTNGPRTFPFGGFARVGDVLQAPFIGHYIVVPAGSVTLPITKFPTRVIECNPVTIDATLVDDNDPTDDAAEALGRFIPIAQAPGGAPPVYDDYATYGYYTNTDPDPGNTSPQNKNIANGVQKAIWRYHWALSVMDQFTTVSNPERDFYPNMEPKTAWTGTGNNAPVAVTQTAGVTANTTDYATEGLVNINSAPWRVIAAMEMIPRSLDSGGVQNARLAKLIVRYRDIDDGIARKNPATATAPMVPNGPMAPQGHGPFKSIMELNKVFDPANPNNTFQNALGLLPMTTAAAGTADLSYFKWGHYSPGPQFAGVPVTTGSTLDNRVDADHDWMPSTLMVRRISNLVTLRSDSFTAYVIVQGWRNAGTAYPELVLQKRIAAVIDRSALGNAGGTVRTYNIPTD